MKNLNVALVVPNYVEKGKYGSHREDLLRKRCHANQIDLVIYPECFLDTSLIKNAVALVKSLAEDLRTPVLSGVSIGEGYEVAAYVNPDPKPPDTKEHLYVKHSSADRLAYQRPGYQGRKDPMFEPIKLFGHKLGVMVCHDMFFGLITALYLEKGATGLVDITGVNVKLKKWRNITQARSIEVQGPFFCTMAKLDCGLHGQTRAIVHFDGADVEPLKSYTRPDGTGGFEVFPWMIENPITKTEQNFSPKKYTDIRVSIGGSDTADISVCRAGSELKITGTGHYSKGRWHGFDLSAGRVGVLTLPVKAIFDPSCLYKERPPEGTFNHHIVVYYDQDSPIDKDRVIAMARLRAIEHRIAAAVMAGDMKEMIKTDNYKQIQRFKPEGDVFGLNTRNLGGTHVTYSNAIPQKLFGKYLELL